MTAILEKVRLWAVANKKKMFLGEFGVADTTACTPTLKAALVALRDPTWAGWTYWSAGAWWSKDYIFNVEPSTTVVRNHLTLLSQEWKK
jgi:endoglucanase